MRFSGILLPLVVATVVALAAFAAPASAAAPAPVPTWKVGQSVGYGTSLDLGSLADSYLLNAIRKDPGAYNITTINQLNVTGTVDSWEVDTVTNVTSTYYTLGSQSASGVKLHVAVNVTLNNVPVAGTYQGTIVAGACAPPTIPKGSGTVGVNLDATSLAVTWGARRLQVSNLAYVNETQNAVVNASVAFQGTHLPRTDLNQSSCTYTVSYDNPTFTLTVNTLDQVRETYTPTLDYFNFPISDNKTWWANTTATLGATFTGTINEQGLSTRDAHSFFDNLTKTLETAGLTPMGLDSFPIDLAKVSILAGPSYIVNNGVVTDYPVPSNTHQRAIAAVKTLSDDNQYPVYLITSASYTCPYTGTNLTLPLTYAAVYAPDFPSAGAGMIVGYDVLVCAGTVSVPAFELTNTKPADAQKKIGQTETNYQIVPPPQGNALANFFLESPYWGILLVVVVIAAVAAALLVRRRRRPTPAPPPPPPSGGPGTP
ncbi:MAG TPA: hypothetical protein VEY12_01185 [Thermoplasmata archaeon]|nr:hypothetical protein [Thermoplasmata archaeon]